MENQMSQSTEKKRVRANNFSPNEIRVLLDTILLFKKIVENKKTDAATNAEKEEAWKRIATRFNAISGETYRTAKTAKTKFDLLKKELRKKCAYNQQQVYLTGDRSLLTANFTDIDEKILAITSRIEFFGLESRFDSDAHFLSGSKLFEDFQNKPLEQTTQYGQEGQDSSCSATEVGLQSMQNQPTTSSFVDMPFSDNSLLKQILPPPSSASVSPAVATITAPPPPATPIRPISKPIKKSRPLQEMPPIIDSVQNMNESINRQSNEFETFANYLATVLKSLPLNLALKVQREIQLLVIDARLKCLNSWENSSKSQRHRMNSSQSRNSAVNDENRRPGDDSEYPIMFQTDTSNDVDDESEFDFSETPLPKVEPEDPSSVPIEFDPMAIKIKEELIDEHFENSTAVSSVITDVQGDEESHNLDVSSKKKRKLDETQTSDYHKRPTAKSLESNDEFYYFGKSISSQLMRLPKDEAKEVQKEIQRIILEKIAMAGESILSRNT